MLPGMASESGQWARPAPQPAVAASTEETSEALLVHFFSNSRAAASVAGRLRSGAEVGVTFTDVSGDFRFHAPGGKPTLERKKAASPDFDLRIGPGAVRIICE